MATLFIDGEAGTTGLQIRDKLAGVPGVKLASLPAEARKDPAAKRKLYGDVDVVILCLPDEAAKEAAEVIESMGDQGAARHRRLLGPPGRARLDLRVSRADRGAGRGGRQGAQGHQSRLPRDRRDRAPAPARRRRAHRKRHGRLDRLGQRLFGRRQVDDRGLRDRPRAGLRALRARRSSTSTCRRSSSIRA